MLPTFWLKKKKLCVLEEKSQHIKSKETFFVVPEDN